MSARHLRWLSGALLLALALLMWGAPPGPSHQQAPASRAVYVYMCGGDLETNAGRASADLAELVAGAPASTTIIVQTGGAKAWRHPGVEPSSLQRWLVTSDSLALIEAVDLAAMSTADTFAEFLRFATSRYPADKMSLVLWGHGNGISVCVDQLYHYGALDAQDIKSALGRLDAAVRFDVVAFDACHAATLDLALAVGARASYVVASVDKLPGSGLDYAAIDFDASGLDLAKSIAEAITAPGDDGPSPSLSVLQTDRLPPLDEAIKGLDLTGLEPVAAYLSNAYFLVDASHVEALHHLVSRVVVYQTASGTPSSGISVVVPR